MNSSAIDLLRKYDNLKDEIEKLEGHVLEAENVSNNLVQVASQQFAVLKQWIDRATETELPSLVRDISDRQATKIKDWKFIAKTELAEIKESILARIFKAALRKYREEYDQSSESGDKEALQAMVLQRFEAAAQKLNVTEAGCDLQNVCISSDLVTDILQSSQLLTNDLASVRDVFRDLPINCTPDPDISYRVSSETEECFVIPARSNHALPSQPDQNDRSLLQNENVSTPNFAVTNTSEREPESNKRHVVERQVFVTGFSMTCNEETFSNVFQSFGPEVISIKSKTNINGRISRYGFVTLRSKEAALEAALSWNGSSIDSSGQRLVVLPQDQNLRRLVGAPDIQFSCQRYWK